MNGATTEPLVKTISPPKIVISTSAGRSQNFFRASMNATMSFTNDIETSKRLFQRLCGRSALAARDPVRVLDLAPDTHRIDPECAHQQPGRNNGDRIHPAKKDRIGNFVQQEAKLVPAAIGRLQGLGLDECGKHQERAYAAEQRGEPSDLAMQPRAHTTKRERNAADDQTEALVARDFDRVLARKLLVQSRHPGSI